MSRLRTFAALGIACAVCACTGGAETQTPVTEAGVTGMGFLYDTGGDGFARVTMPKVFEFPVDHGPHPAYRTEWWYTTGNLRAASGREFGFELTFFRVGVVPPGGSAGAGNSGVSVWMAHFATTDPDDQRFRATERLARGDPALAYATAIPLEIRVEDWTLEQLDPVRARLRAAGGGTAIDLIVSGLDRLVLQGDDGLDRKGPEPGNASYYYSAPRLEVSGNLRLSDRETEAVSGTAWLDHEWSSSALSRNIVGWDWFALQLDDGRDVMVYRLRDRDGRAGPFSSGSVRDASGAVTRLGPADFEVRPLRSWTSPITGIDYPIAWRLQIGKEGLDVEVRPLLDDQEVNLSARYWEGAIRVFDANRGRSPIGRGYLELAGYR